jgi:hypothetical protein
MGTNKVSSFVHLVYNTNKAVRPRKGRLFIEKMDNLQTSDPFGVEQII